jgi:hypothetical protein
MPACAMPACAMHVCAMHACHACLCPGTVVHRSRRRPRSRRGGADAAEFMPFEPRPSDMWARWSLAPGEAPAAADVVLEPSWCDCPPRGGAGVILTPSPMFACMENQMSQ